MNKEKELDSKLIVLFISLAIITAFALTVAPKNPIARAEQSECLEWQEQASEIPGFYLLDWQKNQCERHGIEIEL